MPRLIDEYRGVVCDLDGVVYRGADAVGHAVEVLDLLRQEGVGLVFATNNASRPPADVARQLEDLGLTVETGGVVTSAQAGASRLAAELQPGSAVLAVGGLGVAEALTAVGLAPSRTAVGARAVLQGYGPDVTASDLAEASYAVAAGATWVATNRDPTLPTEYGVAPGNGALVDAVAQATGLQPVVVGKPQAPLYELSLVRLGLRASETLAVGDRLDTDIAGARAAGLDSLWVLTGVEDLTSLVSAPHHVAPSFVALDLRALTRPAARVHRADGWWVCDDARLRVDLHAQRDEVSVRGVAPGGTDSWMTRNALLSAGFHALLEARSQPDVTFGQLTRAAVEVTRLVF